MMPIITLPYVRKTLTMIIHKIEEAWPYMTIKMSALLEASVIPKLKGRLTRSSNSKMDY